MMKTNGLIGRLLCRLDFHDHTGPWHPVKSGNLSDTKPPYEVNPCLRRGCGIRLWRSKTRAAIQPHQAEPVVPTAQELPNVRGVKTGLPAVGETEDFTRRDLEIARRKLADDE
jgi:hypothetical protein